MLEPGDQIDIWVVERALGSGGMGSVYRCHNRAASRIMAAVKVLESSLRRHPEAEARFIREAEILFQLDHPNIVKVRNIRTDVDPPYLEMDFVSGVSLEERLRSGAVPYDQAVPMMRDCASALTYLHAKGVRHRDIKPANLLIDDRGQVKLVDFGLAMEADTSRLTQQGMAFGTVSYAPPEWIAPDTLDPAMWDIYAMGVVFYELLTGTVAFPVSGQGSARQQAMQVIVGKQNHPPLDPGAAFSQAVRQLVRDMTAARPEERISTTSEVHDKVQLLDATHDRVAGVTLMPSAFDADGEISVIEEPPALPDASGRPTTPPTTPVDGITLNPATGTAANRRPSGIVAAFGAGAALLLVGVLVLIGVGTDAWLSSAPATRAVQLVVDGPQIASLSVAIGDRGPDIFDGNQARFDDVEVGEVEVVWALGQDCHAPCIDGCSEWCGTGSLTVQVPPGSGTHSQAFEVPKIPAHVIRVHIGEVADEIPVLAMLGEAQGTRTGSVVTFAEVPPGRHALELTAGSCPDEAAGCADTLNCPPGCASQAADLVVHWADGATASVDLAAPLKAVETRQPAPSPTPTAAGTEPNPVPIPKPAAAPSAGVTPKPSKTPTAGRRVTVAQVSKWLAENPEYQRGGAKAAGWSRYLDGWDGSTPPPSLPGNATMVGLNWIAVTAFCGGNQSVASVHAEPVTFAGGDGVFQEWRQDGTKPKLRAADTGQTMPPGKTDAHKPHTAFRCTW